MSKKEKKLPIHTNKAKQKRRKRSNWIKICPKKEKSYLYIQIKQHRNAEREQVG
jgi:hypothetical protein